MRLRTPGMVGFIAAYLGRKNHMASGRPNSGKDDLAFGETPKPQTMALEGAEALELYTSAIYRNMTALAAAVGSLETMVAELKQLQQAADPQDPPKAKPLPND
jgi:hypothetical protein